VEKNRIDVCRVFEGIIRQITTWEKSMTRQEAIEDENDAQRMKKKATCPNLGLFEWVVLTGVHGNRIIGV
jgi:hypothetical protein